MGRVFNKANGNVDADNYQKRSNKLHQKSSRNKPPTENDDDIIRSIFKTKIDQPSTSVKSVAKHTKEAKRIRKEAKGPNAIPTKPKDDNVEEFNAKDFDTTKEVSKKYKVDVKQIEGESFTQYQKRVDEEAKNVMKKAEISLSETKRKAKWKKFNEKKKENEKSKRERQKDDDTDDEYDMFGRRVGSKRQKHYEQVAFGEVVNAPLTNLNPLVQGMLKKNKALEKYRGPQGNKFESEHSYSKVGNNFKRK